MIADVEEAGIEPARAPAARIVAFRHPGLVAMLYAYRLAVALIVAAPLAAQAAAALPGYVQIDSALFAPGSVLIVEVGRLHLRMLPALGTHAATIILVASLLGLVPFAIFAVAVGHERASPAVIAARVARAVPTLVLLLGLALMAEVVAAALVVLLGNWAVSRTSWVPPREDVARALVACAAALVALGIGVVHDLARICAVDGGQGVYAAASRALMRLAARPMSILWAYAWRAALGALALAFAIVAHGGAALYFHQGAVIVAVCARASWLCAAMREMRRDER